jgi:hypothetical protein
LKPRNTLILVAVLALLGAYVFYFELNKTPEQLSAQLGTPTAKPQPYVFQFAPSDVQSLEVRNLRDGREIKLTRKGEGWQIIKPMDIAADASKIEQAVGQVAKLQASRVLTDVTDIQPFGLMTAMLEVRLELKSGSPFAVTVGGQTPDSSNYYVSYTGDTKQVFIVGAFVIDGLKILLDQPPLAPTPTPTFTPTSVVPTTEATPPAETATPKP